MGAAGAKGCIRSRSWLDTTLAPCPTLNSICATPAMRQPWMRAASRRRAAWRSSSLSLATALFPLVGVHDQGDRAIVDQVDIHMGAEHAAGGGEAGLLAVIDEQID